MMVVGVGCVVVIEDVGWLWDVLGVVFFIGIFVVFFEFVVDLFGDLVVCYVCIYGLFMIDVVVVCFGFGVVVV